MALDPSDIERKIGYRFKDHELLRLALIHASAASTQNEFGNERLEFIGDAVIDLAVARILFDLYGDKDEGWLTQIRSRFVDEEDLAVRARTIDLGGYLTLSKGEEAGGGRAKSSILAGAYEALMGAVFLDGGYDACESVIRREFYGIEHLGDGLEPKNFKSLLQELLQKDGRGLPRYEVMDIGGPEHERSFVVAVFVEDREWGRGTGKSKKEAEIEAARRALFR